MPSDPSTNVWEIAQYVEGHPESHDQRWRLAKKLYMSMEYRLALEHLQILKNEWPDRVNIRRYLAATYYRLSRYEESVSELDDAIRRWPKETGLREQFAKALDRAGKRIAAADAWGVLAKMNPDHPYAAKASRVLRERELGREEENAHTKQSQLDLGSVLDTEFQVSCSHCGMKNGPEYERCWSCHAELPGRGSRAPAVAPIPKSDPSRAAAINILAGLTIVGLLSLAVYRTLTQWSARAASEGGLFPSIHDLVVSETILTRIVVGVVLLIAWPVALRLAVHVVGAQETQPNRLHMAGIFLAALTYVAVPWPSPQFLLAIAVPAIASLVIVVLLFSLSRTDGLIAWAIQGLVVTLAAATTAIAFHGFSFALEFPAISTAASSGSELQTLEVSSETPLTAELTLAGTGAAWLDDRAARSEIEIQPGPHEGRLFIEVLDGPRTLEFTQVDSANFRLQLNTVTADRPYVIKITSEDRATIPFKIAIESLLTPLVN